MEMREEKPTVVDVTNEPFDNALNAYVVAEAEVQAATARRDAAKRAVMRARPAGVTSVEVTRRLKAAAAEAEKLVQIMVTKDHGAPRLITLGHFSLSSVESPETLIAEVSSQLRSSGASSRS